MAAFPARGRGVFILLSLFFPAVFHSASLSDRCSDAVRALGLTNRIAAALVETKTGELLFETNWQAVKDTPIPVGSIIKIYALLAGARVKPLDPGETHPCRGNGPGISYTEECWLREGHGTPDMLFALSHSCNTWFYYFVKDMDYGLFLDTLRRYGALRGSENFGRDTLERRETLQAMTGKMNLVKLAPADLLLSFRRIMAGDGGAPSSALDIMRDALHEAYSAGTASKARKALGMAENLPVMCKTGTGAVEEAGSVNVYRANGFFVGLWEGRYAVFAMAEDSSGADGAARLGLALLQAADGKGKSR